MAALGYGKNDVADVTKDEIKIVSIIWFGSIALIVSTIGTVLALISYILRDPEAFVERKRFSLSRRINRVFYLIFWRMNRVLLSGIKLLGALIRLILSFAEIFRGIVGIPTQRAIRRTMLAMRRRANRPKIETVEKVVEKVVEKIVKVEVPVEKVAIKEVPVEIVRKEIVYVPLYSTEAGMVDASTELKGSKPRLVEDELKEGAGRTEAYPLTEDMVLSSQNNSSSDTSIGTNDTTKSSQGGEPLSMSDPNSDEVTTDKENGVAQEHGADGDTASDDDKENSSGSR